MNTLESATTISPSGLEEECALFKIDTTSNPFVFSNITSAGNRYTLTIWVKADAACKMVAAGTTIAVTTEWKKHIITYTAEGTSLIWLFQTTGNYYVYHSQLELGNVSTDWAPAPEDNGESIEAVNQDMQILRESVSQLSVNADGITETVSKTEEVVNMLTGDVEKAGEFEIARQEYFGVNGKIDVLKVAHHGSSGSSCEELLKVLNPKLSLISCGKNNSYGHPHEETLERLEEVGSKVMSTVESGAITIKIGKKIKIYGFKK